MLFGFNTSLSLLDIDDWTNIITGQEAAPLIFYALMMTYYAHSMSTN